MENIKWALSSRADQTPEVAALLGCLHDVNLDVVISSFGGVGSTELSNFLTRHGLHCNLVTDQDNSRHVNRPPQPGGTPCPTTRVVYLFGDPLASVASHYRRDHAYEHAVKTSGHPLRRDTFPSSFEQYVSRGEDLFGYEAHLNNWLTMPSACDVLFVRYENLFDPAVAGVLMAYACAHCKPADEVQALQQAWCASKRQRQSVVSEEKRAMMYQGLTARVQQLPPVFIRKRDGTLEVPAQAYGGMGGAGHLTGMLGQLQL